ncbi:hypothetical protein PQX77_003423 [Marasmius sp. AFHP31]|nr:hypothetical protein PQX77_018069 [Marasmius sp. AFHP31]KAK1233419.1 hypothetical protein PQX77_003423 [Marasmius sp. AFHP31]
MSQPPAPNWPTTRGIGKNFHVDDSLRKYTREERQEMAAQKKRGEEERRLAEKQEREQAAEDKKQRLSESGRRLARFEDRQALVLALRSSLRPDLQESTAHLPFNSLENPPTKTPRSRQKNLATSDPSLQDTDIVLSDNGDASDGEPDDAPPPKRKKPVPPASFADKELTKPKNASSRRKPITKGKRSTTTKHQSATATNDNESSATHNVTNTIDHEVATIKPGDGSTIEASPVNSKIDISDGDWKAFLEWRELVKAAEKERLKAEKRKMANERRKIEKSAIREAVAANRTTKPAPSLFTVESANVQKRPASGEDLGRDETQIVKKAKMDGIGGLRADFHEIIVDASAQSHSVNDAVASDAEGESDGSSGPELVGGSFDEDESPDVVAAMRKSKIEKKTIEPVNAKEGLPANLVLSRLVPADVNSIDAAERQSAPLTKAPSSRTRQAISIKSLPFPANDFAFYKKKWNELVMPQILVFTEPEPNQFTIGNQPDLSTFVQAKWKEVFPELKDNSKNKEIMQWVRGELRQYRSDIGKEALKIVSRKVEEAGCTVEERSDWVKRELENERFLFLAPGETKRASTGAMRGPGIMETFAYHLIVTTNIERQHSSDFKFPAGAVALSAAAYERALKLYEPGYNRAKQDRKAEKEKREKEGNKTKLWRKDKDSFSEGLWADSVKSYHKILKKADWAKWRVFEDAARRYLPEQQSELDRGSDPLSGSDEDDERADIMLSSES